MAESGIARGGAGALSLRGWFLLFLAIGASGVFVAWPLAGERPQLAMLLTLGAPLSAMAAYIIVGHLARMHEAAPNQFGDSVYFLGFLFTLLALSLNRSTRRMQPPPPGTSPTPTSTRPM